MRKKPRASASSCCRRPAHAKSSRFGNEGRRDNNPRSLATGRASATASAALPDDDADGLRAAFRKAAKASHPDVNPGNPEAAERLRRIVRANAILSDEQQREVYDRLLEIARRQQSREPKRSNFYGTIRRLAADAIASAAVSAVLVGCYLLFKPVDARSIASA